MDGFATIATSYAPGHNFWPGPPWSWWLRGGFTFSLVTGPVVAIWFLVVLTTRRKWSIIWPTIAILMLVPFAILTNSIDVRDGDMPWFLGVRYGRYVTPWLLTIGAATLPVAILAPPRLDRRPGFDVELRN